MNEQNVNFKAYLEADEYILWQGKPEAGSSYFRREDIARVPFGIFFFVFACFWAGMASMASFAFSLFALPFMAVGLYMSFGIVIHRAILLKKTDYAITNKKLIRVSGSKVDMVRADQVNNMQITMNKDGTGTIVFLRQEVYYRGTDRRMSYPGGMMGFYSIDNVKDPLHVQKKINEMER